MACASALTDTRCIVLLLTALATMLMPPQARAANRDALRQIVQDQCVVDWLQRHHPAPCERVVLPNTPDRTRGYAVLADRKGGAHFLLIPTDTMTGIESPEILQPDTPDYFAAAWDNRDRLAAAVGHGVRRDQIGLAVNSQYLRGQDQLHIHIECLRPQTHYQLEAVAAQLGDSWSPVRVEGWHYLARRALGEDLDNVHPFQLLADRLPQAKRELGSYTLIVAGMQFEEGPGFILLAGRLVPPGERLLDSTCAIARW